MKDSIPLNYSKFTDKLVVDRNLFLKELTKFKTVMTNITEKQNKRSVEILDHCYKYLRSLKLIKEDEKRIKEIMQQIHRKMMKVKTEALKSISDNCDDKVALAINWLALKLSKRSTMLLKDYCAYFSISAATILKIDNSIKELLTV
jgi:hypothetical protein